MELWLSQQICEKYTDINFCENSSSKSRVVSCGRMTMTKLVAAFRNTANASKNGTWQGWSHWVPTAQTPQRFVGRGVRAIIDVYLMKESQADVFDIIETAMHVKLDYCAALYSPVWNLVRFCTHVRLVYEWLRSPNLVSMRLTRQTVLP